MQQAPGPVEEHQTSGPDADQSAPGRVAAPAAHVAPLAPGRFALQFSIGQSTLDDLRYAQALASHQIPPGDLPEVFGRALKAYIRELEKTRFAATDRPRAGHRQPTRSARHIPAAVKRAVWERDQGQCTFTSETGHRCASRTRLEYDHIDPVCRGGQATVAGIRLRCRAHNQYEAERMLGADFMSLKRETAQRLATARRHAATAQTQADNTRTLVAGTGGEGATVVANVEAMALAKRAKEQDVVPWLRGLGFRAEEARQAAALCENIPDAPLEQRVRVALSYFHKRRISHGARLVTSGLGMTG